MYYSSIYFQTPKDEEKTKPPFRVLYEAPGFAAFVEFDDDALPVLQGMLGENGEAGWFCDHKRRIYKATADSVERTKDRQKRGFLKKLPREMRKLYEQSKQADQMIARDTAFCAALTEPVTVPEGHVKRHPRDLRFGCAKPGAETLFRYSLRSPKVKRKKDGLPLLVVLHGAGCNGYDGVLSLAEAQLLRLFRRQDYHMLVPQLPFYSGDSEKWRVCDYNTDGFSDTLCEVIGKIPDVDSRRVYIAGISFGGFGAVMQCLRKPGFYAACLPSVAWLFNLERYSEKDLYHRPLDEEAFDILAKTPMWLSYSRVEQKVNDPLYEALRGRGTDVRRTKLGRPFGHGMWTFFFTLWPWKRWMRARALDESKTKINTNQKQTSEVC